MRAKRLIRTAMALATCASVWAMTGLAFAEPQQESGFGLPHDASENGHRIDWLIKVTMGFVTILFVIMCIWLFTACLKHREQHEAEYDHGDAAKQIRFAAGLSALIFFVVDGNLWINATIDVNSVFWNFSDADKKKDTVRIELNAHQWAWDARYAGPDGKFNTKDDIVMLNDIRVPVGAEVLVEIASADVIHSFSLPNLRIKQDATPGMVNRMLFQAKETGEFDIACTQHCGTNHYKMKGTLTILSPEDFKKWADKASADSARAYNEEDKDSHWGWDWKLD